MGAISFMAKKTFATIFKNLSTELTQPYDKIQLGIFYNEKGHKYEVFITKNIDGIIKCVKEKEIEIDDYINNIFNAGSAVIETTIGQAGHKYVRELNDIKRKEWLDKGDLLGKEYEIKIDEISVIMQYKEDSFPNAALMLNSKKQRFIDIEKEFLN